jgi:hypothetical protein
MRRGGGPAVRARGRRPTRGATEEGARWLARCGRGGSGRCRAA